ncbi:MAG: hypothetical protein IH945_09625, partial [Armatimonadetes bacterium]|nr:hypothetical protein [Armatimonadota bacterium]
MRLEGLDTENARLQETVDSLLSQLDLGPVGFEEGVETSEESPSAWTDPESVALEEDGESFRARTRRFGGAERSAEWRQNIAEFRNRTQAYLDELYMNGDAATQERIQSLIVYQEQLAEIRSEIGEAETDEDRAALFVEMRETRDAASDLVRRQPSGKNPACGASARCWPRA